MKPANQFTARLISVSASGYATSAAHTLLAEAPKLADRFGGGAYTAWQAHLEKRLEELAAALLAEDPGLFIDEVNWSAEAFRAREVPVSDLRASLEILGRVLERELPEEPAELAASYVEQAIAALGEPAAEADGEAGEVRETEPEVQDVLALVYLEAALSGDRRRAIDAVLAAVDDGLAVPAALETLLDAQQRVGDLWHAEQIGVAQEHVVTETTRTVMALLSTRAQPREPNGKAVMVALAPGNSHSIGARVVATHFELAGWRTMYLADPLPAGELLLGLEAFSPHLLALSMSLSTQLGNTIDLVTQVRDLYPEVKVLVGGRRLVKSPQLCETIGADACGASLAEALRLAAELVGLESSDG